MKVTLNIKLTPKQKEVEANPARFKIWKAGRRGAKTYSLAYFLAKQALLRADKHWYVTKTLALAREEFFPVLLNLLPRDLVSKVDDRSLNVRLTNGSIISCKSAEKEDNLRGRGLGSFVLDEAAFVKPIYDRILRPQLAASKGPAMLASSPRKGWFTSLFNEVEKSKPADWAAFHSTIYDNPHIDPSEIEAIKARTPLNTWLQEYMAQEVSDDGQVYEEFSDRNIYDPAKQFKDVRTFAFVRGLDYGLKANTGASWIGISPEGYLIISDEYIESGLDVGRHATAIHGKSQGLSVKANVLDRSAFRDEGTSMTSIAKQFDREGIRCQESERDVDASVDIMRKFINGDGVKPWLYVSAKCAKTIEAFQTWEHGSHEPDIAAAARYGAVWAVVKRLTRLCDAVPTFKHHQKPVSPAEADLIFAAQARIVTTNKRKSWGWDRSAGVPI